MSGVPDPARAPSRPDLTFLRHRSPAIVPRPEPPRPEPPKPEPPKPEPSPIAGAGGTSLDLGIAAPPDPAPPPTAPTAGRHQPLRVRKARRTVNGTVTRLSATAPSVTLNRLQSGIGSLEFSLSRAAGAGELSLGCVYQLQSRIEGVIQTSGATTGPPGSPLPLLRMKMRADGDSVSFDLRQITTLRRALLYGYSPSGAPTSWSGTIVASTFGGAQLEIPLAGPSSGGTLAMVTIYNVDGELVLRSEMEQFRGRPQRAAEAFGFQPWIDG